VSTILGKSGESTTLIKPTMPTLASTGIQLRPVFKPCMARGLTEREIAAAFVVGAARGNCRSVSIAYPGQMRNETFINSVICSIKIDGKDTCSLGGHPLSPKQKYWFPAKRYGWGWGPPSCWQGWVVIAFYYIFLGVGALSIVPQPIAFITFAAILTFLLFVICWFKGEPTRWRWGKD